MDDEKPNTSLKFTNTKLTHQSYHSDIKTYVQFSKHYTSVTQQMYNRTAKRDASCFENDDIKSEVLFCLNQKVLSFIDIT